MKNWMNLDLFSLTQKGKRFLDPRFPIIAGLQSCRTFLLFLVILLFSSSFLVGSNSRYFDYFIHDVFEKNFNTVFYFKATPQLSHIIPSTGAVRAELEITIEFRDLLDLRIVSQGRYREAVNPELQTEKDPYLFLYRLNIPPGEFRISIEVLDRINMRMHYSETTFLRNSENSDPRFSDILLFQSREDGLLGEFPVLNSPLNAGFLGDQLKFSCQLAGNNMRPLTAKAILYKRESAEAPGYDDKDLLKVNRFSSIMQVLRLIKANSMGEIFNGSFSLKNLEPGEYLIEVILGEGEFIISERSRYFSIEWNGLKRVYADLEKSILMMRYVATDSQLSGILSSQEIDTRLEKFHAFWNLKSEFPAEAIREYFEKVFYCEDNFREDSSGWLNDRSKYYCLLGPPSEEEPLAQKERKFLSWKWNSWGLKMVFEKKGKKWKLVNSD